MANRSCTNSKRQPLLNRLLFRSSKMLLKSFFVVAFWLNFLFRFIQRNNFYNPLVRVPIKPWSSLHVVYLFHLLIWVWIHRNHYTQLLLQSKLRSKLLDQDNPDLRYDAAINFLLFPFPFHFINLKKKNEISIVVLFVNFSWWKRLYTRWIYRGD